jgi:hypothetical protein
MKQFLFDQYGFCEIPVGTYIYRMGKIDSTTGAFFALHPRFARCHRSDQGHEVKAYKIQKTIQILFLISHLNHFGLPIGAVKNLYESYVGTDCKNADDITVKFENYNISRKLTQFLMQLDVSGWLSSMENKPPLEIFLTPAALYNIKVEEYGYAKKFINNSLRQIKITPTAHFIGISKSNIDNNFKYLLGNDIEESQFSIFEKIFK